MKLYVVTSKRSRNSLVSYTGIAILQKKHTLTSFVTLGMRTEGNAPIKGEPSVGFSFTTMLQHTGRFWSSISYKRTK